MAYIAKTDPILITGGSGFVGSHLIEHLLEQGYTNLHSTSTKTSERKDITVHSVDLTNLESTMQVFREVKPVWIFHLASIAAVGNSFDNQALVFDQNTGIQRSILEAMRIITPQARMLCITSAEIYGKSFADSELPITEEHPFRPVNPYAVSKIYQDSLAYMYYLAHNLDIVRVRPFNHIGERQTNAFVVASVAEQIAKIEKGLATHLQIGNTESIRDFSDVKDIVRAYVLLVEKGTTGDVYNVGSGHGHSIKEVITLLTSLSSQTIPIQVDSQRLRPSDIPVMIADIKKIKNLGWEPTIALEDTLHRILEYWRKTI